jgi:hypothetical protein
MEPPEEPPWFSELREKAPPALFSLTSQIDGAVRLVAELQKTYPYERFVSEDDRLASQRVWELFGLFYLNHGRNHEALALFEALYEQELKAQETNKEWFNKGTPLVWISDCYFRMGFVALAKRYLMLTLCEDAVTAKGEVRAEGSGYYWRAVVLPRLPHREVAKYVAATYRIWETDKEKGLFPEWVLQQADQLWMTEFPTHQEAALCPVSKPYIRHLLTELGDPTGKSLEQLAEHVLLCMPGCRTTRRQRSPSTDYDIVCSIEGLDIDFRSELGRYFLCECKDWKRAADFTTVAKFCRVLDSTKCRFGILFSTHGISGQGKARDAERETIKVFQDRGVVIVVVDKSDLESVAEGVNFVSLLRAKYERVRLDLAKQRTKE